MIPMGSMRVCYSLESQEESELTVAMEEYECSHHLAFKGCYSIAG
jgi:hypothetical protein